MTNRVAVDRPVTLRSVNGPGVTVIQGYQVPGTTNGDDAIRCVYLTNGAVLSGFTLTNGATRDSGDTEREQSGGGVWSESINAVVTNCTLIGNSANANGGGARYGTLNNCTLTANSAQLGGGAHYSTLNNCTLTGNPAYYGGGAHYSTLNNCTLTGNSAHLGGGTYYGILHNCILYYNTGTIALGFNYHGSTLNYCCSTPMPDSGAGNITAEPQLANAFRLSAGSPCRGTGSSDYSTGVDIDGEPWLNPPSIGCDEYQAGGIMGALAVAIGVSWTNVTVGFSVDLTGWISGRVSASVWDFGDGTVLSNRPYASHAWSAAGDYTVVLRAYNESHPAGVSATVAIRVLAQPTFHVSASSSNPEPPYDSWATAARTIQEAVDAAEVPGAVVLVTNGVYATGGRVAVGMTNRVAVDRPVMVRSVNGPTVTSIVGTGSNGSNAVRCVYLTNGAVLAGFTLTNGAGGVRCESINAVVTNCTITGNSAGSGGGARYGTLNNCTLTGNSATSSGGGAYESALNNCTLTTNSAENGGGVYYGTLNNCTLANNSASSCGGGVYYGTLSNCTLSGNSATGVFPYESDGWGGGAYNAKLNNCTLTFNSADSGGGACDSTLNNCTLSGNEALGWPSGRGGGAWRSTLNNCTVTGNSAEMYGGGTATSTLNNCTVTGNWTYYWGGGVAADTLNNCILYDNFVTSGETNPNYDNNSTKLNYCCTWPMPTNGVGNLANDPKFLNPMAGDYRLSPTSPCIDAGINQDWMFGAVDLDGNPRILNGTVDMGAYETPFTLNLRVWLQGPYLTNSHAMLAGNATNLPLSSPYAADPRQVAVIPSNVVDWVLVELHGTNGNTVVVKSAFLNAAGQVLSLGGTTGITAEVSAGYYSIVVKHRNHLAVMSAEPVAFTNYLVAYDFTTNADRYYGGASAAVELEPGVWGMIAGDADGDGEILAVDGTMSTNQLGQTGYLRADFNLDGVVSTNDFALWTANQGRTNSAANAETILSSALTVSPGRKTLLPGSNQVFRVTGNAGAVAWAFVKAPSGGTITSTNSTSAIYQAGSISNCVDVIEAWDTQGRLGRAYVNVISPEEVSRAGKAIVLAGQKSLEDPLWPVTDYLGNLAYNTLLYRGFDKDNVQYLNPVREQDVDGNGELDDVALPTTWGNVASTFTNWAVHPDRLFLYLVDHGGSSSGEGYFRLNASEVLTASQLDGWLDAIQSQYSNDVVVVIDCCESGSFLEPLSYNGPGTRTVITACGPNEPTYFVAGGQVSFSDAFFSGILMGLDLQGSFVLARDAMSLYQSSQISTNLPGVYLGPSFVAGKDVPQIGHVMGRQLLYGASEATLWAYDVVSVYPVDRVWCVVVPPGHSPNPTNAVADLPTLDLAYNASSGRYEAVYSGFTENDVYKLMYYARDVWGSVSLPHQSYVTQNGFEERVILVAGGPTNDTRWAAIDNLAGQAYRTFQGRWLGKEKVHYLSPLAYEDVDQDGTNDVNALPTLENLQEAMTTWTSNANKLTVYLVGQGTNGLFRLNATETLSPNTLRSWLDSYQSSNQEACVVMDFAGAGAFLPGLKPSSGVSRICVASAQAGRECLFANGGMVSFSQYFLSDVLNGYDITSAFARSRDAISRASGQLRQHALLDDNGDGKSDIQDGLLARRRHIGTPFLTGADMPVVGAVMPNVLLSGTAACLLWASEVTDVTGVSNVWCVITPPDYQGEADLPQTDLTWNATTNRFEVGYTNFTSPGTYVCTFYVRNNAGEVSSPRQAEVIVSHIYEGNAAALATVFSVGDMEQHDFASGPEEHWVKFYAPTGLVFNVEATQLGDKSDVRLDLYYEQAEDALRFVGSADRYGPGAGFSEGLMVDLKTGTGSLLSGVYYVRVSSADTNLFGPGSEYELRIYVPIAPGGGVIRITSVQGSSASLAYLQVIEIGPPAAIALGGGWRVPGSRASDYSSSTDTPVVFSSSVSVTVEFYQVPGWDLTSSIDVPVALGNTTLISALYTRSPSLSVTPAGSLAASGYGGGPFAPTSITYTLRNSGESPCNWSASSTASWLTLSRGGGVLAPGGNNTVTASLNANASGLPAGTYTSTVGFTNLSNTLGNTSRSVSLVVSVHPLVLLANPQLLANGSIAMTLEGVTNRVYSIVGTTNLPQPLTNWTEGLRLTNTAGQTRFTNPPSSASPQFYRARELGEP